jgi:hypothetical protein
MTRDDVIRMAREDCDKDKVDALRNGFWTVTQEELERFAALVVAAERNRKWTQAHWTEYERSIAAAEREACAKICDKNWDDNGQHCANAIRARSKK